MNVFFLTLKLSLKIALARRAAFFTRLIFVAINHSLVLIAWLFFFKAVPVVHGWTVFHLMLAYGLAWFAWGFVSFFAYGYRILPRTIEFGELDHFLLQPRPLLITLAANSGDVFGIPDMALAALLIGTAGTSLHANWILVVFAALSASVVFTSFTLIVGSLAFWLDEMHDFLADLQYNFYIFATRPTAAFRGWIKVLMLSIIPTGFVSFLPVEVIRLEDTTLVGMQTCAAGASILVAVLIFHWGLRRYESGNRFGVRN